VDPVPDPLLLRKSGSAGNRRRNTHSIHVHIVFLRSVRQLLVTANVVPRLPIVTLLMKERRSSETLVLTRVTRRNIPEDAILDILMFVKNQW
jgi:hypothetical protein